MRVSTNQMYMTSAYNLQSIQSQLYDAQNQLSTGKKIQRASDSSSIAEVITLSDRISTIKNNQDMAKTTLGKLEANDSHLQAINTTINQVRDLTIQKLNSTNSVATTEMNAQLTQLKGQLLDQVNAKNEYGQYIFSGYQGGTQPYVATAGVINYQGDSGNINIQLDNYTVKTNVNGNDLFATNVFTMIDNIIANPTQAHLAEIDQNLDKNLLAQVNNGNEMHKLDFYQNLSDDLSINYQQQYSKLTDVDYAEQISKFAQLQTMYEASLKTTSSINTMISSMLQRT